MHQITRQTYATFIIAIGLIAAAPAQAHVGLNAPNGGESLDVDSTFTVSWEVLIAHDLQNWDLWYSHSGPAGPWIEIAMDLPAGSGVVGSVHTYDWTIPDAPDDTAWVRVRMDNSGTDYEDVSAASFEILSPCDGDVDDDGVVGFSDLLEVLSNWGPCDNAACASSDVNDDGAVDFGDLLMLLSNWGECTS